MVACPHTLPVRRERGQREKYEEHGGRERCAWAFFGVSVRRTQSLIARDINTVRMCASPVSDDWRLGPRAFFVVGWLRAHAVLRLWGCLRGRTRRWKNGCALQVRTGGE